MSDITAQYFPIVEYYSKTDRDILCSTGFIPNTKLETAYLTYLNDRKNRWVLRFLGACSVAFTGDQHVFTQPASARIYAQNKRVELRLVFYPNHEHTPYVSMPPSIKDMQAIRLDIAEDKRTNESIQSLKKQNYSRPTKERQIELDAIYKEQENLPKKRKQNNNNRRNRARNQNQSNQNQSNEDQAFSNMRSEIRDVQADVRMLVHALMPENNGGNNNNQRQNQNKRQNNMPTNNNQRRGQDNMQDQNRGQADTNQNRGRTYNPQNNNQNRRGNSMSSNNNQRSNSRMQQNGNMQNMQPEKMQPDSRNPDWRNNENQDQEDDNVENQSASDTTNFDATQNASFD
jgi:hypothetical protein